jgi:ABC-2 type transport system permease protein
MKRFLDFYLTSMKIAVQTQFQYRAQNYFYMIGMIAEPVIYLVVWSTVANQMGGSVGGYTAGAFAAYYIVWTLVRNMNIVFTPYGWEERIQRGQLSGELLRPIHPVHGDVSFFAGWKFVMIVLWLPLAVILALIFHPVLHPTLLQIVTFLFAIWGAYLIRTFFLSLLGMITFWTTRVGAIYELYFALELILSGRLVPMGLMPGWVQNISKFLPFQWTFFFPINALVGTPTLTELLGGLVIQLLWIMGGILLVSIVWHFGIRRFSSVGN